MLEKIIKFLFFMLLILAVNADIDCLDCNSSDVNCISDTTKVQSQPACATKCFTSIDNSGKVTRGCLSENQICAEDGKCRSCNTAKCNNQNICQECNSSTDAKCAQSKTIESTFNNICLASNTQCYVGINEKNTIRRCASATDKCDSSTNCQLCTGGNCNSGIYPSNRLYCYQCVDTNTNCANPLQTGNSLQGLPCVNYVDNDTCYVYGTNKAAMTRGCQSDTSSVCSNTANKCFTCNTDMCNIREFTYQQKLSCIQCNSQSTPNCIWAQPSATAKDCNTLIPYYSEGGCYTELQGNVVYRGCLMERETSLGECSASNNCRVCNSANNCNNRDEADFTCLECRSDENIDCRIDPKKIKGVACTKPVNEKNAVCYVGAYNDLVVRGCLVDADGRMQLLCTDKANNQCKTCTGKDCNNAIINASSIHTMTISLLFICSIILQKII